MNNVSHNAEASGCYIDGQKNAKPQTVWHSLRLAMGQKLLQHSKND